MKGLVRVLRPGERFNHLVEFYDGAGPAVGHHHGQCGLKGALHVEEMDVDAIDFGDELLPAVEFGFEATPVIATHGVA